jgi:hypothetical protein
MKTQKENKKENEFLGFLGSCLMGVLFVGILILGDILL